MPRRGVSGAPDDGVVAPNRDLPGRCGGHDQGMSVLLAPVPAFVPPRRSAPVGVHVVAVLQYLGSVAALAVGGLFAYLTVVIGLDPGTPDDFIDPTVLAVAFGVLAGLLLVAGVVGIVLGRKVQVGRQWARVVLLMLCGLTVIVVAGSIVLHQAHWTCVVFTVYPTVCAVLLNTRTALAWFR